MVCLETELAELNRAATVSDPDSAYLRENHF